MTMKKDHVSTTIATSSRLYHDEQVNKNTRLNDGSNDETHLLSGSSSNHSFGSASRSAYQCLSIRYGESSSLPLSSRSSSEKEDDDDDEQSQEQDSKTTTTSKLCGRLLLTLVAFLYGTLNVVLRYVYELPNPPSASVLSCTRGWLSALCFVPVLYLQQRHQQQQQQQQYHDPSTEQHKEDEEDNGIPVVEVHRNHHHHRPIALVGFELAFWNFGAQGLLALGLVTIESARASFFVQTSVVMTPIVSRIAGHKVKWNAWAGCLVALLGLFCLSDTSQGFGHFGLGDILCLMAALSWSMYIFRLSFCQHYDEIQLQAIKNVLLAGLYSVWVFAAWRTSKVPLWLGYTSVTAWLLLLYSAIGPGTFADVMQQKGQAVISAAEGNVILSMEPVFTALLGLVLLGEDLSGPEILGGGLIVVAAIVATQ